MITLHLYINSKNMKQTEQKIQHEAFMIYAIENVLFANVETKLPSMYILFPYIRI